MNQQLALDLNLVLATYSEEGQPMTNAELYDRLADTGAVSQQGLEHKEPIGKSGESHSKLKRAIRWHQQTLKAMGLLEGVPGKRGMWQRAQPNKAGLREAPAGVTLVAYSTELGCAIWGDNKALFRLSV